MKIMDNVQNINDVNIVDIENVELENNSDASREIDEVFENAGANVDNVMSDEDDESVMSDDFGCISDDSEDLTDRVERTVPRSELHALNRRTRHCAIYFYYSTGSAIDVCASCMVRLSDMYLSSMIVVREHLIM